MNLQTAGGDFSLHKRTNTSVPYMSLFPVNFNIVLEYYNFHNRLVDCNLVYYFFYITDQLQGCVVLICCVRHRFSAPGCYFLFDQWGVRLISLCIWEV